MFKDRGDYSSDEFSFHARQSLDTPQSTIESSLRDTGSLESSLRDDESMLPSSVEPSFRDIDSVEPYFRDIVSVEPNLIDIPSERHAESGGEEPEMTTQECVFYEDDLDQEWALRQQQQNIYKCSFAQHPRYFYCEFPHFFPTCTLHTYSIFFLYGKWEFLYV